MRTEVVGTSRLSLCGAHPDDFAALFERVFSDAVVMRHVLGGMPLAEAAARAFYTEKLDTECTGQKPGVLVERASGEVGGFAGLMPCTVLGLADFELGFALARTAWGKGYAQEIGHAQLAFGFGKLGCNRLLSQVAPQNAGSIKALLAIGMQLLSTVESPGRGTRRIYVANAPI